MKKVKLSPQKENELGEALENYTNPAHPEYDAEFSAEIKKIRPDWIKEIEAERKLVAVLERETYAFFANRTYAMSKKELGKSTLESRLQRINDSHLSESDFASSLEMSLAALILPLENRAETYESDLDLIRNLAAQCFLKDRLGAKKLKIVAKNCGGDLRSYMLDLAESGDDVQGKYCGYVLNQIIAFEEGASEIMTKKST